MLCSASASSPSSEESAGWDSLGVCRSANHTLGVWDMLEGPAPLVFLGIDGSPWVVTAGVRVMWKGS